MNAVEIEEAVSELAAAPFDAAEFPFAFLTAFGNRQVTVQRLRAGSGNASDVNGGVLQRNNIHLAVCPEGRVGETLAALRDSPKTAANKVKFILATDGGWLEAEELGSGDPLACPYPELADHFAFFLPLAGISTVKQIKDNPVDIKATGRLNKLYVELLKDNLDWATAERRPDLNHFMARLIFCMFAEDTGIFKDGQFSATVEQMSDGQSVNTHEIIAELFRAMATAEGDRAAASVKSWAARFPFVNGGLFANAGACPRFSRIARTYLLRAGALKWQEINPDIFGSMIQAVADEDERGDLGMHYTSVPNILKVLNPLFLDDLRAQLEAAGDSVRKLRALRRRIAAIRVFDPACGSGNFLVIAYKEMREIEHQVVRRIGDAPKSWIKLDSFYGIEIKSFAAEIARLALLIAEFQCDVLMISQQEARSMVLPLHKTGQIKVGNALRIDWKEVCPPVRNAVLEEWDLAGPTGRLALEDNGLANESPTETYVCGNPPYAGSKRQSESQRNDMSAVFGKLTRNYKTLDYVSAWFIKAADFITNDHVHVAFVATNSICQGEQVSHLWPLVIGNEREIFFAHRSFQWSNLAGNNAVVTCVIVGVRQHSSSARVLIDGETARQVRSIGPYLVEMDDRLIVERASTPLNSLSKMQFGNHPYYGAALIMSLGEAKNITSHYPGSEKFLRRLYGTDEFIEGKPRVCIWLTADASEESQTIPPIEKRIEAVRQSRLAATKDVAAQKLAAQPYRFRDQTVARQKLFIVARHSSENRDYLPADLLEPSSIVSDAAFILADVPLWNMAIVLSRLHLIWVSTVCGKLETRYRYSNTLGWNTFPVAVLTDKNKFDLNRCAEEILLARETHFPDTIGDLYDPAQMPDDLRHAHERNDETLERIYIGRRFRNDTERLEKLFDLYARMATSPIPKLKGVV